MQRARALPTGNEKARFKTGLEQTRLLTMAFSYYAAFPAAARLRGIRRGQSDRDPVGRFGLTQRNNLTLTGFRTADVPYAA